jgi:DNA-binding LytR/AlgR family response regulator
MNIKCIVIDDEDLARKGMMNLIKEIPYLTMVGEYSNALDAMHIINDQNIELLFLDIQIPKISGLEFLKNITNPPVSIITTAFSNYALESFELNVIDYLVKPIPFERFLKAVSKANDYLALKNTTSDFTGDYFFIKCESRYEKIMFNELLYVEALQNYVMLHTVNKQFISYLTFKSVEAYLPADKFLRVHKSYIVSILKVDTIENIELKIGKKMIPISRTNKEEIVNAITGKRLLKR